MEGLKKFNGRYKLANSENFDNFMKALNVGLTMRALGNTLKPSVIIAVKDDQVTLMTVSTFKNTQQTFKFGEEADENTIDGRHVKTTITLENEKLVQRQLGTKSGDKNTEIVREMLNENEMLVTMTVNLDQPVVAKRWYKRE